MTPSEIGMPQNASRWILCLPDVAMPFSHADANELQKNSPSMQNRVPEISGTRLIAVDMRD
jgi:hypothetical protein